MAKSLTADDNRLTPCVWNLGVEKGTGFKCNLPMPAFLSEFARLVRTLRSEKEPSTQVPLPSAPLIIKLMLGVTHYLSLKSPFSKA
jgi:hypothetical protein